MTEMTQSTQPVSLAQPIGDHLAQHPFLRTLDGEFLNLLAAHARVERFAPGTYLLRERHAATVCYLIEQGRVALEINGAERGQIVIETIEAGECLGWSWLFPPFKWHFSGRAIDTVQAIVLDGVSIRELCESNLAVGYELMKRIAAVVIQRLQATRLVLLDIYGPGKRGHL